MPKQRKLKSRKRGRYESDAKSVKANIVTMRGCTSYLSVSSGTSTGTVPFTAGTISATILNPVNIGAQIATMSTQYTYWRVRGASFHFQQTGMASPYNGSLAIGICYDADEKTATAAPSFLQVSQLEGAKQFAINSLVPQTNTVRARPSPWLYTSSAQVTNTFKERMDALGTFYGQFDFQPSASSVTYGYIVLTYHLEFRDLKFSDSASLTQILDFEKLRPSSFSYIGDMYISNQKESPSSASKLDEKSSCHSTKSSGGESKFYNEDYMIVPRSSTYLGSQSSLTTTSSGFSIDGRPFLGKSELNPLLPIRQLTKS